MKSLFDRIKIYQYLDRPIELPQTEVIDGIILRAAENAYGYLTLVRKTEDSTSKEICTGNCHSCASACQTKNVSDTKPNAAPAEDPIDLADALRTYKDETFDIMLVLESALSDSAQRELLVTLKRTDMTHRLLLVSRHHKTLDALTKAEPALRISPLCGEELVRPWIYAAYMGAPVLCMDARDVLLDADRWGAPLVDRAHNSSVTVFAWNAEDEDTIKALIAVGCDAILTHIPETAHALVW